MDNVKILLDEIKKHKEKLKITDESTIAERLRYKIMSGNNTSDDWLKIEREVRDYIVSSPPKEEIEILNDCCEMLVMTCSAIRIKHK